MGLGIRKGHPYGCPFLMVMSRNRTYAPRYESDERCSLGRVRERVLWTIQRAISECRGRNAPSESEASAFRAPQTGKQARSACETLKGKSDFNKKVPPPQPKETRYTEWCIEFLLYFEVELHTRVRVMSTASVARWVAFAERRTFACGEVRVTFFLSP